MREPELRSALEDQGFRVEDRPDGFGWAVYAPKGVETPLYPSGVVRVHTSAFKTDKEHALVAVMRDLGKIGFDPTPMKPEAAPAPQMDLGEVYDGKPADPEDPDDRWVTFEEGANLLGMKGPTGVAQRVRAGKLRAVKLPVERKRGNGQVATVQVQHVHFKELMASGTKGSRNGRVVVAKAGPVRTSYQPTAAGRTKEAAAAAKRAMTKIRSGFDDLDSAIDIIITEADGALQELADVKHRMKSIEDHLGKAVAKL